MTSQEMFHLQLFPELPDPTSPILGGGFAPGIHPAWSFRYTAYSLEVHSLSTSGLPLPSLKSQPPMARLCLNAHPVLHGHEILTAQPVRLVEPEQGILISLCHQKEASFIHVLFLPETGRLRYLHETDHASRVWLSPPVYPNHPLDPCLISSSSSSSSSSSQSPHPPSKPTIQECYYVLISLTVDGTLLYRRIPTDSFLLDHQRSSLSTLHVDSLVLGQLEECEDATCVDIAHGPDDTTIVVIGTSLGRALLHICSPPSSTSKKMGPPLNGASVSAPHHLPCPIPLTSVSHIQLKPLVPNSCSQWTCAISATHSSNGTTRPLALLIHVTVRPAKDGYDTLMDLPDDSTTGEGSVESSSLAPLHTCTLRLLGQFIEEGQLTEEGGEEGVPSLNFSSLSESPLEVQAMSLGIAHLKGHGPKERLFLSLSQDATPGQLHLLALTPSLGAEERKEEEDCVLHILHHHVAPGIRQIWENEGRDQVILDLQGDPQSGECHLLFPGSLALWTGLSDQLISNSADPDTTPDAEREPEWLTILTKAYPLDGAQGHAHAERVRQRRLASPTQVRSAKSNTRLGLLLFDHLLRLHGVPLSLYPPKDAFGLNRLTQCILSSSSTLEQSQTAAILYYLWLDAQAYGSHPGPGIEGETACWAKEIPHDLGEALHAYWLMDQGREEEAIARLTRLLPAPIDWVNHIWAQCYSVSPVLAMRLCQTIGPGSHEQSTLIKVPSDQSQYFQCLGPHWVNRRVQAHLGAGWIKDAYLIVRQEGKETDGQLMRSFVRWCLYGKNVVPGGTPDPFTTSTFPPPRKRTWEGREGVPERLRTLMTLPLEDEDEAIMVDECYRAVEGAKTSSEEAEIAGDFLIMYYIHRGRYVEAMWTDERIQRTQAILQDLHQPSDLKALASTTQANFPPTSSSERNKRQRRKEAMLSGLREMLPTVSLMALREQREAQGDEGSLQWERIVERIAQYKSDKAGAEEEEEEEESMRLEVIRDEEVESEVKEPPVPKASPKTRKPRAERANLSKSHQAKPSEETKDKGDDSSEGGVTPVGSGPGDHSGGSGQHSPFTRPPSIPKDSVVEDIRSRPTPSSPSKSPRTTAKKGQAKTSTGKKSQKKASEAPSKKPKEDVPMLDQGESVDPPQEEKSKVRRKRKTVSASKKDEVNESVTKEPASEASTEVSKPPLETPKRTRKTKKSTSTVKKQPSTSDRPPEDPTDQVGKEGKKAQPEVSEVREAVDTKGAVRGKKGSTRTKATGKKGRRNSLDTTKVTTSPSQSQAQPTKMDMGEEEKGKEHAPSSSSNTPMTPSSTSSKANGKRATTRSMTKKDD